MTTKADRTDERRRIHSQGGEVHPIRCGLSGAFVGPARVWVKNGRGPGLAVSRAIGDSVANR